MNKKIGPLLLSGLMIGPLLGSGIVLLPPMAYKLIGNTSIWAWLIMMVLGGLFAFIFAKLTILYPGEGGMTNAIEASMGKRTQLYASFLMIAAVSFGPTAIMLTASDYLIKLEIFSSVNPTRIAMALIVLCMILLSKDLKAVSTISFIISTLVAITFIACAVISLLQNGIIIAPPAQIEPLKFGKVVLLLFWAIIGWEVVGNYSNQVKSLNKTIPQATTLSVIVVSVTYLLISLALQSLATGSEISLVPLIRPIFGLLSEGVLAFFITGLCISTYLLIVGALIRLVGVLASDTYLPKYFAYKNQSGIPTHAIYYFGGTHLIILVLKDLNLIAIDHIVSAANVFFLANAILGLIASYKIVHSNLFKISSAILICSFTILLLFSSPIMLISLPLVYCLAYVLDTKKGIEKPTYSRR